MVDILVPTSSRNSPALTAQQDMVQPLTERGYFIEGTGVITEVYAQSAKLLPDGLDGDNDDNYYEFSLFELKYGGDQLTVNDLTHILYPQGRVAFTADTRAPEMDIKGGFGFVPTDPGKVRPRVVDLVRLDFPDLSTDLTRRMKWLEEDCGSVLAVNDNHGFIKSERWGKMRFEGKALVLSDEKSAELRNRPLRSLVDLHRTVCFKCYSPPPDHSNWTVISVSPLGEIFEGEGVVTEVKDGCAFIVSLAFGRIYMPFGSLKVKRELMPWKSQIFKDLRRLKVRFKITDSLPGQKCRWRALTVRPL